MSGDIATERTARKRYTCAQCPAPIEPGQRYIDSRLPPGGDPGRAWRHVKVHLAEFHPPEVPVAGDAA